MRANRAIFVGEVGVNPFLNVNALTRRITLDLIENLVESGEEGIYPRPGDKYALSKMTGNWTDNPSRSGSFQSHFEILLPSQPITCIY